MNIDSFIKMGEDHTLFEDAVITGVSPFHYIIVADGCSGSENTHLGSQLLARAAEQELLKGCCISDDFGLKTIKKAREFSDLMGLNKDCLDATLLIAYVKDNKAYIWMTGDGSLYYDIKGDKTTVSISYFDEMPYYLNYLLDENRILAYQDTVKERLDIKKVRINNSDVEDVLLFDYKKPLCYELDVENLNYLILSTDGIDSFQNKESNELINLDKKVHDFKNYKGEFLKRRIKRILKENTKSNNHHSDDIGIAAISFNN